MTGVEHAQPGLEPVCSASARARRQLAGDVNVHAESSRGTGTVPVESMYASMARKTRLALSPVTDRQEIQAAHPTLALALVQRTNNSGVYSYMLIIHALLMRRRCSTS